MRRGDPGAYLVIAALGLALHAPILRGQALLGWDTVATRPPWAGREAPPWNPLALDPILLEFPHAQLARDEGAPRWNPYLGLGERTGQFNWPFPDYPPARLGYALLPPWLAPGVLSLLHLVGAGLAAFAYLRWRGHGARPALLGAIAAELSPFGTAWLEAGFFHWPLAPWAILALWGSESLARRPQARTCALLALALGAGALAGHPQHLVALYAGSVAVAALLGGRRALAWGLTAAALGALLGAARLLPLALEFLDGHRAPEASWPEHLAGTVRLGPKHLLLLALPDVLGHPLRGFNLLGPAEMRYANFQEVRLTPGLVALALLLLGVRRGAAERRLALLAGLALLLAFPTPLARLLAALPGWGTSAPTRILWLCHWLVPPLVAAGAERLRPGALAPRRLALALPLTLLAAALALSLPVVVAAITPAGRGDPGLLARRALAPWSPGLRGSSPLPGVSHISAPGRQAILLAPTLGPLLLGCALGGALLLTGSHDRRRRRLGLALLAGLSAAELLREGQLPAPHSDPAGLYPLTPGLERLRTGVGADRALLGGELLENSLMPARVRTLGAYGSLHPARLVAMLEALGCPAGRQLLRPAGLPAPWRDALAVRAVVTGPGATPRVPTGLQLDYDGPDCRVWLAPGGQGRLRLYPADAAWVRADRAQALDLLPRLDPLRTLVVEDELPRDPAPDPAPPRTLTPALDAPERIEVEVDAPEGGWLLVADAWAPGWSAELVDGPPLRLLPADVGLRAVELPAGLSGRVRLVYAAPGTRLGPLLGLLTALALILLLRRPSAGVDRYDPRAERSPP